MAASPRTAKGEAMIYPPELEAILERPNTTDERRYSRQDVIDAYNLAQAEISDLKASWELLKGDMQSLVEIRDRLIAEARQAGHREGFNAGLAAIRKYAGAYLNVNSSVMTPNQREGYHWVIEKSRALIDSPKAEVEKPHKYTVRDRNRCCEICGKHKKAHAEAEVERKDSEK